MTFFERESTCFLVRRLEECAYLRIYELKYHKSQRGDFLYFIEHCRAYYGDKIIFATATNMSSLTDVYSADVDAEGYYTVFVQLNEPIISLSLKTYNLSLKTYNKFHGTEKEESGEKQ